MNALLGLIYIRHGNKPKNEASVYREVAVSFCAISPQ